MILFAWVLVTTTLLISVEGESGCPTVEELKKMAKALTDDPKAEEALVQYHGYMAQAISKISAGPTQLSQGIARFVLINERFQQITSEYGRVLMPEPKGRTPQPSRTQPPVFLYCNETDPAIPEIKAMVEKFTPAFNNLTDLVNVRFEEASQQAGVARKNIEQVLKDHELSDFRRLWTLTVVPNMDQLRTPAKKIIERKFINSLGQMHELEKRCSDNLGSPKALATMIWAFFGAGCKNPPGVRTTTTIGQFCDRDHPSYTVGCTEVNDTCYAEVIIERDGYDHRTAARISAVVTDTILELSTYHSLCVNYTYVYPHDIEAVNENFFKLVDKTVDELSKIIVAKAEHYWPGPAEELAKICAREKENATILNAKFCVQERLDEKYFWYHHDTFATLDTYIVNQSPKLLKVKYENKDPSIHIDSGWVHMSHYRYATDEDKAKLKTKYEKYVAWLGSRMTGDYSEFTVLEFLNTLVKKDEDWSVKATEVLRDFAGGESADDRMSEYINVYLKKEAWYRPPFQWTHNDQECDPDMENQQDCSRTLGHSPFDESIKNFFGHMMFG